MRVVTIKLALIIIAVGVSLVSAQQTLLIAVDYVNQTALESLKKGHIQNGSYVPLFSKGELICYVEDKGKFVTAPLDNCLTNRTREWVTLSVGGEQLNRQAETLQVTLPRNTFTGAYYVTLLAFRFSNVSTIPTTLSRLRESAFGTLGVREYYDKVSNGKLRLMEYTSRGWGVLPKSTSQYCSSSTYFYDITVDALTYAYNTWGIVVPDNSFVIIYLNTVLPCASEAAGMATVGFYTYSLPYGTRRLGVSLIFHYSDYAPQDIDTFAHEIGHNLGLVHSGISDDREYENPYDVMGSNRIYAQVFGITYLFPPTMSAYYRWYLGWVENIITIPLSNGTTLTLACRDSRAFDDFPQLAFAIWNTTQVLAIEVLCTTSTNYYATSTSLSYQADYVVVHLIDLERQQYGRRWVSLYNWKGSRDGYQGIWTRALVKNVTLYVQSRNGHRATIQILRPTIANAVWSFNYYGSFIVGQAAKPIDTIGAIYYSDFISPAWWAPSSLLDAWVVSTTINWAKIPGRIAVSSGGPGPNLFTRVLNPPNSIGADNLPFYYDSNAGGIRDARTGALYTGNVFLVALVYIPQVDKYAVLSWGLTGIATYASAVYATTWYINYKAVVVRWSDANGNTLPDISDNYTILAYW